MSAAAPVKVRKPPKPRDRSVLGTFESMDRRQVVQQLDSTNWAVVPTKLIADRRVFDSASKVGVVDVVAMFTAGRILGPGDNGKLRIKSQGKAPEWTPNLITSDFNKLLGISKRQMTKAVTWCVEMGFIERKGETGQDRVRFRVNYDAIRKAPNAKDPDEIQRAREGKIRAEEARQHAALEGCVGSENGSGGGKSHSAENTIDSGGGCGTQRPHAGVLVIAGKEPQAVIDFSTPTGETRSIKIESDVNAEVSTTVSPAGDIVLKISTRRAEAPAPKNDAAQKSDFLADQLAARQLAVAPDFLRDIFTDLKGTPVEYFLKELDAQIDKAHAARKSYKKFWLRGTARDAAGQWPAASRELAGPTQAVASAPSEPQTITAEAVVAYLKRAAEVIAPVSKEIAAGLRKAVDIADDFEAVEARLDALFGRLLMVAQAQQPKEALKRLQQLAAAAAAKYSDSTSETRQIVERQTFVRELLKAANLPRLSLFCMEDLS